jgi:DNA-binding XRE family transcriptional regulator
LSRPLALLNSPLTIDDTVDNTRHAPDIRGGRIKGSGIWRAALIGAQLKSLREAAGFTQEELATIAGLSVHAISALERGQRRRPQVDTLRALSAALDLTGTTRGRALSGARERRPTTLQSINSAISRCPWH